MNVNRAVLAVAMAGCASSAATQGTATGGPSAPVASVHGVVQSQGGYCGGAAPTQEMLAAASRPNPVASAHFLVRVGTANSASPPEAQFTTKPDGSFELAVPPGDYCIVTDAKRTLAVTPSQYADRACLEQVQRTCDATWHVPAAGLDGSVTMARSCFGPCYHGPMPP